MQDKSTQSEQIDSSWKWLFYAGGVALLLMVIIFRRNFGVELLTFAGLAVFDMPQTTPVNAVDWFALFQKDSLLGLLLFGLFDLVNYLLIGFVFLALYGALKPVNKSAVVVASALGFLSIAVYIATNQAFAMFTLSQRYVEAITEAQQVSFLGAGEALLAQSNPGTIEQGTGFYFSLFLVLLAGLIVSIVMLRSPVFNKATAFTGILANGIGLCYFPVLIFAQSIVWLPHSFSAVFRMVWYILTAIQLFRLGRQLRD